MPIATDKRKNFATLTFWQSPDLILRLLQARFDTHTHEHQGVALKLKDGSWVRLRSHPSPGETVALYTINVMTRLPIAIPGVHPSYQGEVGVNFGLTGFSPVLDLIDQLDESVSGKVLSGVRFGPDGNAHIFGDACSERVGPKDTMAELEYELHIARQVIDSTGGTDCD